MAYTRTIKLYESDGSTLDTAWYSGGVINWSATRRGACVDARYDLGCYGGCLDATITIAGNVRDGTHLANGQVVKMFYASGDSEPVYTGIVKGQAKYIEGVGHEHTLFGLWRILEDVDLDTRDTSSYTSTTVDAIIHDLYTNHISALSLITASDITASSAAVTEFIIEENADIYRVIEQLAMIASSDGDYWVAGVEPDGTFYFHPVSTTAGNVQSTFAIGTDATQGREEAQIYRGSNRITLKGAVTSGGYPTKIGYEDDAAIAANGASPRRQLRVQSLRYSADLVLYKTGYFNLYADPGLIYDRVSRVHTDGDTVPKPWAGQVIVSDDQRGTITTDYCKRLTVNFNNVFEYVADIGKVSLMPATQSEPSLIKDVYSNLSGGGSESGEGIYDILAEAAEDVDPYTDAPGFQAGGSSGVTTGRFDAGAIIEVNARGEVRKGEDMSWEIMVHLAGQTAGTGTIDIYYTIYDDDETTELQAESTATASSVYNDGNYEVYRATATTPNDTGWIKARVRSEKIASAGNYYWFPDDAEDYIVTRMIDTAGGGTTTTNYFVPAGWLYNGQ